MMSRHGLIPSSNEFVPGRFAPQGFQEVSPLIDGEVAESISSMAGMNSGASAWVPGSIQTTSSDYNDYAPSHEEAYYDNGEIPLNIDTTSHIEKMVEVNWNGSSFFVPESMTYLGEDGTHMYMGPNEPEEDDGLEWAEGSVTLPAPPKRCLKTIGLSEPIRNHFQNLDMEALRQMRADDHRYKEIPARYHSAYPLDVNGATSAAGGSFGYPSSLYKVTDQTDSQLYVLRRFDNVRITPTVITSAMAKWHEVRHPNIISLYSINSDKGAIFFAYAYHPNAVTLRQKYIDTRGALLNEALLWRILVQLFCATRLVHKRNMAVRVIDVGHILITSGTVARINCVGIPDVLEFESRKNLTELQIEDIVKLGRVALSLVTRAVITPGNTEEAMGICKQHYSQDLHRCIGALLCGRNSIATVCATFSDRIQDELDTAMASSDALHSHLRNEYENGRIVRLLFKLGFVNDRPEYELDPQWSETGDRYVLKLFRDFLFHQQAGLSAEHKENATPTDPVLDIGHVLSALNKLDVGDHEEILLSSRDGKDLLVVSYADVQRCLESSFVELAQQAHLTVANMRASLTANAKQVANAAQQQQLTGSGNTPYNYGGNTPGAPSSQQHQGGHFMQHAHSTGNIAAMGGGGGLNSRSSNGNLAGGGSTSPVPGGYPPYGGSGGYGGPASGYGNPAAQQGGRNYNSASSLFVPPQQTSPYGQQQSDPYGNGYGGNPGRGMPNSTSGSNLYQQGGNMAGGMYGMPQTNPYVQQQMGYDPRGRGGGGYR